jgi:hypothetical protein
MSFNRPAYDICSYKQTLAESVGPGDYQTNRPVVNCKPCFPNDPNIRLQRSGASISRTTPMVDIDSEMIGIGRRYSRCPENKYLPNCNDNQSCGANSGIGGNKCNSSVCIDYNLVNFADCFTPIESTRLSNPPYTLKETGWNRWEWLPRDPQERVLLPFDSLVNTVQVSKDNHRPCVPNPLDQFSVYPENNHKPIKHTIVRTCTAPTGPPSVQWKPANEL